MWNFTRDAKTGRAEGFTNTEAKEFTLGASTWRLSLLIRSSNLSQVLTGWGLDPPDLLWTSSPRLPQSRWTNYSCLWTIFKGFWQVREVWKYWRQKLSLVWEEWNSKLSSPKNVQWLVLAVYWLLRGVIIKTNSIWCCLHLGRLSSSSLKLADFVAVELNYAPPPTHTLSETWHTVIQSDHVYGVVIVQLAASHIPTSQFMLMHII